MTDLILDDVNILLSKEIGDKRVLEQIKRAAEHDEVISIYERNYVAKLKAEHLEKKPEPPPIEKIEEIQKPEPQKITHIQPPTPKPQIHKKSKPTKVIAGIGGVALAAILIIGISLAGFDTGDSNTNIDNNIITPTGILLSTDEPSYQLGDIISISGKSNTSLGNAAKLSIENSANTLIWTENVNLKSNGAFSTLAIAGGTGWDADGIYTLIVEHNDKIERVSFTFAT